MEPASHQPYESDPFELDEDQVQPISDDLHRPVQTRRRATLYDVVDGRVGSNGFFTETQRRGANIQPLNPERYLLQRGKARIEDEDAMDKLYSADQLLPDQEDPALEFELYRLPQSDLLKAIHQYSSDFFAKTTLDQGRNDFRSLDETALVALGILLEEATGEVLGQNGDMVLVEPESYQTKLPESRRLRHQVRGTVQPPIIPTQSSAGSSEDGSEEQRAQKRRNKAGR